MNKLINKLRAKKFFAEVSCSSCEEVVLWSDITEIISQAVPVNEQKPAANADMVVSIPQDEYPHTAEHLADARGDDNSDVGDMFATIGDLNLPWKYQERADEYTHILRGPNDEFILSFPQDSTGKAKSRAAFVVDAVNKYRPVKAPADEGLIKRPKVICLCGSTRFKEAFEKAERDIALRGEICLTVGLFGHMEGLDMQGKDKANLDQLHLRKIDMSDEVLVLNVGNYIGASTAREIGYCEIVGKPVKYLENHDSHKASDKGEK